MEKFCARAAARGFLKDEVDMTISNYCHLGVITITQFN